MPGPRVTVFTPSHRPMYLDECLQSLRAQTFQDWEWVVVLNAGATWRPMDPEPRLRLVNDDSVRGVGAAKRRACELANGEILVELDHDDLLATTAIEKVVAAFDANSDIGFVYSNSAQILADGSKDPVAFQPEYGWTTRETTVDGRDVLETRALEPSPHNCSYIWYQPNHVRAFRRSAYDKSGGYDASRTVLDDQDLMCRLYQETDFHHIDECLYLQRVHERNTQKDPEINAQIQRETVQLYDQWVQPAALAWSERRGLKALDMGAAHNKPPGYLGVDIYEGPDVDIVADVTGGIPLPDSSVGVVRAVDFLEHVPDKIAMFNELYRVLAHGGILLSLTPSTDGRGAWQDPTHVAFYNENSFWYFTDSEYADFVPPIKCRFQVSRMATYHPSEWHVEHQISYVNANLIAIKDGPRQGGLLKI
ncbi:MAG: hypothetical protein QOE64_1256 [Frankiales bacterium]|jgi:glycosyltransferase involved in cell wall biosynthesis|nr:hypothetical protein [Frankiales bacterium]